FFQNILHEDVEHIIAMLKSRTIPAGELIIREGDTGSSMFLIARGVVRVVKGKGDAEIDLASLLPGDFFGEMALLHDEPRSANCRAVTPCALYELTREDVNKIAEIAPTIKQALHDADEERSRTSANATREA
ncbi:MAG: cyclic nucleotide-binding domain-containing protein, partial [Gammaproteobacteria bacterium]